MKDYEIRRKDRAVDENAALEILKSGSFGVLSTIGADGYPYGVPVNYAYDDGKIYFHCAKNVGHKQDNLRFSGKVSFTVVTKSDVISEKFTTGYESAIAFGYASKTVTEKEKALRIARKVARETAERRDKQNVRGEKANIKRGVPRIVLNALQGKSEKSTGKLNSVHQEKADKLTEERNQLRGSLSPTAALKTDFNGSSLHTGKTLITAKDINFGYHSAPNDSDSQSDNEPSENNLPEQLLWQTPVSFQLKSGDRLRIEGTNGSGKTTLLKIITGQLQPQTGTLTRADFSYVYLNQEYSIIDDRNSVLEQVYAFNNRNLPEHEIKIILNRYLFPASEWDKSCRKLSGGEKMRLAFCCLMISNNTPDMFILDEPTNNLDIQSIDIITATIRNYTGTVIAISHDNYFIREIGIEQRIVLS